MFLRLLSRDLELNLIKLNCEFFYFKNNKKSENLHARKIKNDAALIFQRSRVYVIHIETDELVI